MAASDTDTLKPILDQRGRQYGDFGTMCDRIQAIKAAMRLHEAKLTAGQIEALQMVATKIGRILTGNPDNEDSWRDIAGYATLVANRLAKPVKAPVEHGRLIPAVVEKGLLKALPNGVTPCNTGGFNYTGQVGKLGKYHVWMPDLDRMNEYLKGLGVNQQEQTMFNGFCKHGKASFILGGQFGSEGKGAAAASLAASLIGRAEMFNIVTTNAGVQSGHTSYHNGTKRVLFHLPTVAVVTNDVERSRRKAATSPVPMIYLNAGSIIDPDVLKQELQDTGYPLDYFFIHPNAAVITQECKDAEGRSDSAQTKIASTRKGVGEALSRKVLRSGQIAKDHPYLARFTRRIDLNSSMQDGKSVLVEVPQGISLSLNSQFYPHCTSRDCTVSQAMSDAGIHPSFMGNTLLVLRTFPIRVGNIYDPTTDKENSSGNGYADQHELTWGELGQTPEITTVTKRVRRVFSFSGQQLRDALVSARPTHVFLAFCDYLKTDEEAYYIRMIEQVARGVGLSPPEIVTAYGPTTDDVKVDALRNTPFADPLPLNEFKQME